VTAIWWHHPAPFGFPHELHHPVHREFARQEAATAFRGLWQSSQAFWVNNIAQEETASHKPWQLHLARQYTLPPDIIQKLQALMKHLNLEYGAVDMRLTPDGDYVSLEINPNGEFLYVEQETGLQISRALAEHLHRGRSTRLGGRSASRPGASRPVVPENP
jgi:hypothetical protein